jgi:hypothetical protein
LTDAYELNLCAQVILDHLDCKVREASQVCLVCQDLPVLPVHQENEETRGIEDQKESALRDLWVLEGYQVLALNICCM